jgi:hypothetical protein
MVAAFVLWYSSTILVLACPGCIPAANSQNDILGLGSANK